MSGAVDLYGFHGTRKNRLNSHHNLLQVAIISLMVLCMVCTAVLVMLITIFFFMVCKRQKGLRLITQARYKKLSLTDKDLEETKHENE